MNQPASENSIDLSNVCCDNSTSASSSSSGTILTKKQSTSGLVIDPPLDPQSHSVLSDVMQSIGIHSSPSSSSSSSSATLNGTAGSSIGVAWPKSSLVPDVNNKVESTPNTSNHNNSNTPGVTSATSSSSNASTHNLWAQQWIERLSQQIISDMNSCGICVIDNFLGESRCDVIMSEVHSLYASGHFRNGQLVKGGATPSNSDIRSDKIMWVDGNESECRNIGFLMRTLDKIVRTCTNQTATSGPDDGFEHKNITNRTKAMLACYPGSGTQYVKHVDNPNQDGRAITCIYYLNKNWDVAVRNMFFFILLLFSILTLSFD